MPSTIILDTTPLGLVTQAKGKPQAEACRLWVADCTAQGARVYVPEIADYEIRRELLRTGNMAGVARLDIMKATAWYLPLTTDAMLLAAQMWAQVRNQGFVTADVHAIDGDVILCAQALILGVPASEIIVATSNSKHIRHFLAADVWSNILP